MLRLLPPSWIVYCIVIDIKGESYRLKERKEFMRQKQQIVNALFEQETLDFASLPKNDKIYSVFSFYFRLALTQVFACVSRFSALLQEQFSGHGEGQVFIHQGRLNFCPSGSFT